MTDRQPITREQVEAKIAEVRAAIREGYRIIHALKAQAGIKTTNAFVGEMRAIAEDVARETGISVEQMKGPARERPIFLARAEAMRRIRQTGRYSLPQIGRFFGGRDHQTVWHAIRRAESMKQLVE